MAADPFEQLRQRYGERALTQRRELEQALATGNEELLFAIAHKLKGSGRTFGFPELSRLAEPLELAVEQGVSDEQLHALAMPLLAELQRVGQAL